MPANTDPLNYIRKDEKQLYDPTEYIVLFEDFVNRDDLHDWQVMHWMGSWWGAQKFVSLLKNIPDKFPIRVRRRLD